MLGRGLASMLWVVVLASVVPARAQEADAAPSPAASTPTAEAAPTEATSAEAPVSLPPPTDQELADARHAFEVAAAAFENGDYEAASSEFRNAYELSRHPALLYNIYLAEERAGRPGEAATMLERYLESEEPSAEERTLLERRLERLRTRVASREPVVDPTEDSADRAALIVAPTDDDGEVWIVAPRVTGPPIAGVITLVSGGVLLAAFAVLATLSEVEDQALADSCGRSRGRYCTSSETSGLLALNIAADVSWIAGAAAAAVGLVLLFALPPETEERATPRIAVLPLVSPTLAGLSLEGSL